MRILVSGSTGLVGSALVPRLAAGGHTVVRLVRAKAIPGENGIAWNPATGILEAPALEGFDAVIHLAGESIASGRWTHAKKARIRDSRVVGTALLADRIAGLSRPPGVLLCASAIGFYGHRGDETLREDSAPGKDFLGRVCRDWEAAAEPAARKGVRVVRLRFGVILSPLGGALAKMLTPFRLGLGGPIGDGRQYMSWIAIDDAVDSLLHALTAKLSPGPVNIVSPNPATNAEFTQTLGRVLGRPAFMPMPAFAARLAFGEMADALLLSSQRVAPDRLVASGYAFRYPALEPALRHLLGRH
ncbi:MAG TPA: TIGR01777 family oxidoreductase [Candidatus Polarisedimenticolia bacterium]|nr:TIGR01777 family oxidoreductase [Candidatus Polarisedimenticolia bacterium]